MTQTLLSALPYVISGLSGSYGVISQNNNFTKDSLHIVAQLHGGGGGGGIVFQHPVTTFELLMFFIHLTSWHYKCLYSTSFL